MRSDPVNEKLWREGSLVHYRKILKIAVANIRPKAIGRILSAQHKTHPLPFGSYFTQDHAQNISKSLIVTNIFMLNRWNFVKLNKPFSILLS